MLMRETFVNEDKEQAYGSSDWYQPYTFDLGRLFRDCRQEYGRCTGYVYVDYREPGDPPGAYPRTRKVGWVFQKRVEYETNWGPPQYYLRTVWVDLSGRPGFDLDEIRDKQKKRRARRSNRIARKRKAGLL